MFYGDRVIKKNEAGKADEAYWNFKELLMENFIKR